MSRNIKVKFLGKAPAGFETGDVDFCSEFELNQWKQSGEYKIEVLDKPAKKNQKKKSKKGKK
tara:strand:- start:1844 stop:2029 length:186 start_codon:yes stop_codon:yes gene_type:complete